MSATALPINRPVGRVMIVGDNADGGPMRTLSQAGYDCSQLNDPYSAMAEICRRPLVYRALVVNLGRFFNEELALIPAIKHRFGHIEIWLSDVEGRQAALAEALRLGADGLVSEGGVHRISGPPMSNPSPVQSSTDEPEVELEEAVEADHSSAEPVLTAAELRALLAEN